jgi:hypothetical protein
MGNRAARAFLALVLGAIAAPIEASTLRYALEIPDGQERAFEVLFPVEHPGTLRIAAEWSGSRVIAFRVERPGGEASPWRRSGPPPQSISIEVSPDSSEALAEWKLSIRALASRGAAIGTITIESPDAPEVVRARVAAMAPPPPPPRIPEPWEVEARPRAGAPAEVTALFESVERLRSALVGRGDGAGSDVCGWQVAMLRYATSARDRIDSTGAPPTDATLRYARRLGATVARVEALRTSRDPILAGPVPEQGLRRRAWLAVRKESLAPLVSELDDLSESLRKGFVPELAGEGWPARFVGCLTACERHFEERVRLGADEATNRDLAEAQWERFLLAGDVLRALGRFLVEPGTTP